MPNQLISPGKAAAGIIKDIKDAGAQYQRETGCTDDERKDVEWKMATGLSEMFFDMPMKMG